MSEVGGGRNFGYGKKITWAAKNTLNDCYGAGHFGTKASHEWRWKVFADFLESECNLKDAKDIKKDTVIILRYEVGRTLYSWRYSSGAMRVLFQS